MKLGEFRKATAELPDDTDIVLDEVDCCEFHEVDIHRVLPPVGVLGHSHLLWLSTGQEVTIDLDIGHRIDADHDLGSW